MITNKLKIGHICMGEELIYEEDDLPRKKEPRSICADHKYGKILGGVGIWALFPPNTVVEGAAGDCGCCYQICKRCGKVKMHAIWGDL
jgi:hypothetical protein